MVPANFAYIMDSDCLQLMIIFINTENYWNSKGKLDNGYFFMSHDDISKATKVSDRKIPNVIEGLYRGGVIDVISNGFEKGKRQTNRFRINWDKVEELSKISISDIITFGDVRIEKCKFGDKLTYCLNEEKENIEMSNNNNFGNNCNNKCEEVLQKLPPTSYISDFLNYLNKKENIKEVNNIENFEKKLEIFKTIPSYHDKSLSEMRRCLRSSIEMGRISKEDISYIYDYLHKEIPSDETPSDFEINSNNKYSYMLTQVPIELPF